MSAGCLLRTLLLSAFAPREPAAFPDSRLAPTHRVSYSGHCGHTRDIRVLPGRAPHRRPASATAVWPQARAPFAAPRDLAYRNSPQHVHCGVAIPAVCSTSSVSLRALRTSVLNPRLVLRGEPSLALRRALLASTCAPRLTCYDTRVYSTWALSGYNARASPFLSGPEHNVLGSLVLV
jgi:hypothetical protein